MKWYGPNDAGCYHGGKESIDSYNQMVTERRALYSKEQKVILELNKYFDAIKDLNTKGFHVFKNLIPVETVLKLREEAEAVVSNSENFKLNGPGNDKTIIQPFLKCPTAVEIAFNDTMIGVAKEFFKCTPAIGTCNLRKSVPYDQSEHGTLLYHCDKNSTVRFLKFFVYLYDVDLNNGPFTYVEESVNKKFVGWDNKYRWEINEIEQIYGKDLIKTATGNVGDVIAARTRGFHRGSKVKEDYRFMFTINYLVHPELANNKPQPYSNRFHIKKQDFDNLLDHKKPVADFLILDD